MQSQLYLWHFGIAADAHARKNVRPIIICHAFYQAAVVDMLMGCVNGNSIFAFTDIKFPVSIGDLVYSTDTATVEQQYCDALVLRLPRLVLLTSAVKPAQPVRAFLLTIARTI